VFLDSLKMALWCRNMQELVLIMNCVLGFVFAVFYLVHLLVKIMNPVTNDYGLLIALKQGHGFFILSHRMLQSARRHSAVVLTVTNNVT